MKKLVPKMLVLAAGIVVGGVLIAACEKEQNLSNPKKKRLIAAENIELKKQIEKQRDMYDQKIRRQRKLYDRKVGKQKELLDQCLQEKKALGELSRGGMEGFMDDVLGPVIDENTKLGKEIESLKARIEKLEEELEKLRIKPRTVEKS